MMRKLLVLIISSVFFSICGLAQTNFSGGIFSPTTWTAAGSPYIITGDVVVFSGASLTIEPNVEVRFASGTKLELRDGDLYANGNPFSPITFTLDSNNPATAPKWLGIENTSNTLIDIELSYLLVEYAETGINYGAGQSYRYIYNATFRYSDRGIYDGGQGYNWIRIYDCHIHDNAIGMQGRFSAFDSEFTNNTTAYANPSSFGNINEGGRLINCLFSDNGLAVGAIAVQATFAHIENSTFINNDIGFSGSYGIVINTEFTSHNEVGFYAAIGEVQNSTFTENKVGLQVPWNVYDLSVHDNYFSNDTVAIQIDGAGANIDDNYFCNSILYAAELTTNQNVNIHNNCWCTTNLTAIANMVYDAYDDVALGIAVYSNLSANCVENLVYPGDANNSGMANAWDLLQIGLAYGETGPARTSNNMNWIGQEADDWTTNYPNNVNAKHADSNGDGEINEADINSIELNYNSTHNDLVNYQPNLLQGDPFYLSFDIPDTLFVGQTVNVDILLADATNPINDLYGIAFAIQADESFFQETSFELNINGSWLGTEPELLSLSRTFEDQGRAEIALVRKDQQLASGHGKIASFEFVMSEDIIVSIESNRNAAIALFEMVEIEAITSAGYMLSVKNDAKEVVLSVPNFTNLINSEIAIYPNPASDVLYINYQDIQIEALTILNVQGQKIRELSPATKVISLNELNSGIYLLQIQTNEGLGIKKFVVEY